MTQDQPDPPAVPLVGRSVELRRLAAAVDRAAAGRGGTVLLAGEAGVGKSRLAGEALALAGQRGMATLEGTAFPLHADLAYAPFLEAFGPHVSAALAADLPDLGRLFPGVGLEPAPAPADPALARTRLFDAVARLLARMARARPAVLFVDDLHWADAASVELFHYLARGLAGQPVLLLGAYRVEEAAGPGPLPALLRSVRRLGLAEQVDLGALPGEETAALVRALLDGEPPPDLLATLAARGADTPLFVSALVGSLIAAGDLRRRATGWTLARRPEAAVPAVVRDVILGRLDRLDPGEHEVLEWVVVAGAAADRAVLERVVSDDPTGPLRRLAEAGLLVEVPEGRLLGYRPYHPLLTEITYSELPRTVRRERHAAVARALEELRPGDVERLAHHYRGAGDVLPADRTLDVLLAAADRALDVHAAEEAANHLSAAVDAARAVRPHAVGDLLERLGVAQARAGRTDEAIATWRDALAHAAGPGRVTARLRGLVAGLVWDQGRFAQAEAELAAGFAALSGRPGEPDGADLDTLMDLRMRRIRMLGRVGDREELEREAAGLRALAGDPRAVAALHLARSDSAFMRGRLLDAAVQARRAVAAAVTAADPVTEAHAHRQVFIAELSQGNVADARAANRADHAAADRSGIPTVQASPRLSELLIALATDAWDDGLRTADSLVAFGHRIGAARAVAAALGFRATVLAERGDVDEAGRCIAEAHEVFGRGSAADRHIFAMTDMAGAGVALVRGDAERARDLARSGSANPGLLPGLTLGLLARAELALGDFTAARATVDRLAAMSTGPWLVACAAWLDGLVRAAAEGPAAALQRLDEGAAGLAALGLPFQAARARLDWAEAAAGATAAPGPPSNSVAIEVSRCLAVFDRFDARPLVDRSRHLLRTLGVRPSPGPRAPRADLSPREREVVALVASGLSNAEVAGRLFISPRTVTTHLQHVYARFGLPSRAALVRWALEQGVATYAPATDT